MKIENQFQVKLSNVGTNKGHGTYDTFKDTNALRLLDKAMRHISRDLVGEKMTAELQYCLALRILSKVNYPKDSFQKHLEEIDKAESQFEIIQNQV